MNPSTNSNSQDKTSQDKNPQATNSQATNSQNIYSILKQTQCLRISDGEIQPILNDSSNAPQTLVLIWSQLGDFDNLEYAWWLQREKEKLQAKEIAIRAIGIGDRNSGLKFCEYTGFPQESLFVDPEAKIHALLGLYPGLSAKLPIFSDGQNDWLNFKLMCA